MTKEEIEKFITQFPIYQYEFISPQDIDFNERVRAICKKEMSPLRQLLVMPSGCGKSRAVQRKVSCL